MTGLSPSDENDVIGYALDQAQLLLRGLRHENTVQKETIIQYAAQLAEANAKIQSLEAALKGEGDHER